MDNKKAWQSHDLRHDRGHRMAFAPEGRIGGQFALHTDNDGKDRRGKQESRSRVCRESVVPGFEIISRTRTRIYRQDEWYPDTEKGWWRGARGSIELGEPGADNGSHMATQVHPPPAGA